MNTIVNGKNYVLTDVNCFRLDLTLDCGQAFRWKQKETGIWHGAAYGKTLSVKQEENTLVFFDTTYEEYEKIWKNYFDLERNYDALLSSYDEPHLKEACSLYRGIRILRQEPWEAICSFIISSNNNIPRIKGIIERLCENFGEKVGEDFLFPSAEILSALTVEDLSPIRAGFRSKYILDAARKISCGEVDLQKVRNADFEEAKSELLKISGVGEKVAQCSLLYGFGRVEAFPQDVWVKRIVSELYPKGLPECIKGTEGIAQQYLFHWRRNAEK